MESNKHSPQPGTPGSAEAPARALDEQAGHCFGCGPANPQGLHLTFTHTTDPATGHPIARAQVHLTRFHEGPPGYIHGGIIATLLDEAMSKLNRPLEALAMTRHMEVDYLSPAPLHQTLILIGTHLSREGRKLHHQAELQSLEGSVLARAKGLFVTIHPAVIAAHRLRAEGAKH